MTIQIKTEQKFTPNIHQNKKNSFLMPSLQEMAQLTDFCKTMATSPFYQKLGPGGVMAIYLTAKEYDLPFMACLNGGLHNVDGKITFSSIMINSLILKAGHTSQLIFLDHTRCTIKITRGDRKNDKNYQPLVFTYTIEDAKTADYLRKDNWKKSPKSMLYARAIIGGGRIEIPEVFMGQIS